MSDKKELQSGDMVLDEDDQYLVVLEELRETDDDLIYKCGDLDEVDWVAKERDELLELADAKDVDTYEYHRSSIRFY